MCSQYPKIHRNELTADSIGLAAGIYSSSSMLCKIKHTKLEDHTRRAVRGFGGNITPKPSSPWGHSPTNAKNGADHSHDRQPYSSNRENSQK